MRCTLYRNARLVVGIVIGTVSVGSSAPARAQTWSPLTTVDGATWSVDTNSIRRKGDIATVWTKVIYQTIQILQSRQLGYTSAEGRWAVDCSRETVNLQSISYLDSSGSSIAAEAYPVEVQTWTPAAPGTIAGRLTETVCAQQSVPKVQKAGLDILPSTPLSWITASDSKVASDLVTRDRMSVGKDGTIFFFARTNWKVPQPIDGKSFDISLELVGLNCKTGVSTVFSVDDYMGIELISTGEVDVADVKFTPISAGTIMDAERNTMCAQPTKRETKTEANSSVSSGSSWLSTKGYIVTANHVVEGGDSFRLVQNGKLVGTAEVVASDPANDVAILAPKFDGARDGAREEAMDVSPDAPHLGQAVFTLGFPDPDELGVTLKMTSGAVSALAGRDITSGRVDDVRLIQISIPIQSGNSGGPVMNERGDVVGLVVSKVQRSSGDEIIQNVNYALKGAYIKALLDSLPALGNAAHPAITRTLQEAAESRQSAVFLIIATRSER